MSFFARTAARIQRGDPIPAPLALALSACTPVQRLGMAARRLRRTHEVDAAVVSFGNITVGGTGKTPAVIEYARKAMANGCRVAVLTRGYAAPSGPGPAESTSLKGSSGYRLLGDEAALILQKVPNVVVVKNPDRVAGANRARELGCDTLILDDGFQYLRLARDEDIVLIDATNPFGNSHLLPRGILREPITALARATSIIVTHADAALDLSALDARLHALAPQAPIRHTRHAPVAVRNLESGECLPLEWLRDRTVALACGIANPRRFRATVESCGARVSSMAETADHATIESVLHQLQGPVVITEKDAVRLQVRSKTDVLVLEIELMDI